MRNTVHYKALQALSGPQVRLDEPPGSLSGVVRDDEGVPVGGATLLVASPLGHTYTSQSWPDGTVRLDGVPPGRYVPVAGKRGYDDALAQTCLAGLCAKDTVTVRAGSETQSHALIVHPADPPDVVVDDSLIVSPTVAVEAQLAAAGQGLAHPFQL